MLTKKLSQEQFGFPGSLIPRRKGSALDTRHKYSSPWKDPALIKSEKRGELGSHDPIFQSLITLGEPIK